MGTGTAVARSPLAAAPSLLTRTGDSTRAAAWSPLATSKAASTTSAPPALTSASARTSWVPAAMSVVS